MTTTRLMDIAKVDGPAARPGYVPTDHGVGIVHLGVGAFHRAHQAVMTDDALAKKGGDWRIIGISLRSTAIADTLNPQNGLYTLIERGEGGTSARIIGALDKVIAADPAETLNALCNPAIRVVTLTVTEKGYGIDRQTQLPDKSFPPVASDLAQPDAPGSVLGLLVAAIKMRRAADSIPFTVLSCDNLPENGALLKSGVIGFAAMTGDTELSEWIAENISFPSSMVDRITPASTDDTLAEALRQTGYEDQAAVETEPFIQWVIEDNFPSGRPDWDIGGALFVQDVAPYEQMKLTLLNGSHSMLAYAGFLSGKRYVRDVMADPDLAKLVERHLSAAAAELTPLPGIDFADYTKDLAARFRNPSIAHETYQIAMDGSQKLAQRIFAPALTALQNGHDLRPFAFASAMWMRFCLGTLDDGTAYELRDPREQDIRAVLADLPRDAIAISGALHGLPNLVPTQLAENEKWRGHIGGILADALKLGCAAAIHSEANAA